MGFCGLKYFENIVPLVKSLWCAIQDEVYGMGCSAAGILGDPGADSRGERSIKRAKSVQAEAWCERKFTRRVGTAPGRIRLTD